MSEILYDIKVKGQDNLDKLNKSIIKQQSEIKNTQNSIKEYEKELADLAKEGKLTAEKEQELNNKIKETKIGLIGQKEELKKTNKERRESQKVVDNYNKYLETEIGSNESLKAQLALLTKEYNGMSKEQRTTTEQGQNMQKQIKDMTDELKKNESAVGDNRRNVGNYKEAIEEAFGNTEIFGVSLNGLKKSFQETKETTSALTKGLIINDSVVKSQTASTKGMTVAQKALNIATIAGKVAMNIFKLAIIATGVGAFIVAIGSLVAYFSQTQKGAEAVRKVMAGLGATINVLIDRMSGFGEGLSNIFSGNFKKGFKQMKDSFKGIGDEVEKEVKLLTDLEAKLIELEKRMIGQSVARSEVNKEIRKQNKLAEDTSLSDEERLEAAQKVIDLEEEQIAIENELANQQLLNALQLEGSYEDNIDKINEVKQAFIDSQGDASAFNETLLDLKISETTVEDVQEIADAIIDNNKKITASEEVLTTAQNKRNILEQKIASDKQKAHDEYRARIKEEQEIEAERIEKINELARTEQEQLEFVFNKKKQELGLDKERSELTDNELIALQKITDEYNEQVLGIEEKNKKQEVSAEELLNRELVAMELRMFKDLENTRLTEEQKAQIVERYEVQKGEKRKQFLQDQIADIESTLSPILASEGDDAIAQSLGLTEEEIAEKQALLLKLKKSLQTLTGSGEEEEEMETGETQPKSIQEMLGLDEEGMMKLTFAFNSIMGLAQDLGGLMNSITQRNIKNIQEQVNAGVKSQEDADKEIEKIQKKAFKRNKIMQMATAGINTAQAVIKTLAETTDFTPTQSLRIANAALIGASGAGKIAAIAAQKFKDGGKVKGAGTGTSDSIPAMLSNGEYVINAKAVDTFGSGIFDALNNFQVPRFFSTGGLVTPQPPQTQNQAITEVGERIQSQDFRVINVESDFTDTQNKVRNVERATTF